MIPAIDFVMVANLDRRKDRLEGISDRLRKIGLEFEVFDSFDARELNLQVTQQVARPGYLGNYLTQITILKEVYRRKLGNVLLVEDDCFFEDDFSDCATEAILDLPDEWDMLYFGHWNHAWNYPKPISGTIYRPERPLLRHCVLHRYQSIPKLLSLTRRMNHSIDTTFGALAHLGKVISYATVRDLAYQRGDSDA